MTARPLTDLSLFFRAIRIARGDAPYHETMDKQQAFARLTWLSTGSGPLARRAREALLESNLVPAIPTTIEGLRREGLLARKPRRASGDDEPQPPRAA
jgi:hypothetical protein